MRGTGSEAPRFGLGRALAALFLFIFMVVLGTTETLTAGEGTPVVAACTRPPVTAFELQLVLITPVAATRFPVTLIGSGVIAPSAVSLAVEKVVAEVIACFNAGEPLRAWSLYSNDYIRKVASDADLILASDTTPAPVEPTVLLSAGNAKVLPDGRVMMQIWLDPALIPVNKQFIFIFAEVDGQWLVDDVIDELDLALP